MQQIRHHFVMMRGTGTKMANKVISGSDAPQTRAQVVSDAAQ